MTRTNTALAVDLGGLRQLVERRGKSFAILELVQNAWDENGVSEVKITAEQDGRGRVVLSIVDDAPDGFHDLSHAYTLFAPSRKKADAEKRGRFNIGEKLVIALADTFTVTTTKGGVFIDVRKNTRHMLRVKRVRGSEILAELRMNREELDEAIKAFRTLLPPPGITTSLNGDVLPARSPIATLEHSLRTEVADAAGFLRPAHRKTRVEIYEPLPGERATLYELGIPVIETGDTYHVNVMQKVPLNIDRDNVPPSYLQDVRALVLNEMAARIPTGDAAANWVNDALEDDLITGDAVRAVLDKRFGEKRVVFDMSDPEANRIALSEGYTVIPGRSLSAAAWSNVRQYGAALPAGQVTPSPKPFHPDGTPLTVIDPADYTAAQRAFVDDVQQLHRDLLNSSITVKLAKEPAWPYAATYGNGRMIVNMASVVPSLLNEDTVRTILHEFGHYFGAHLTHAFDDGIALVAARWVLRRDRKAAVNA